jgi:hypothetical protein
MRYKLSKEALEFFKKAGSKGGKLGGAAGGKKAAESMTPEERSQRARKAASKSAIVRSKKANQNAKTPEGNG